eukprot:8224897-Lingulodinium_polyedra.AAC.1
MPDSAAPGMIHEAAPKFEVGPPIAVMLKCRHWRLVTIDGIRARVTPGLPAVRSRQPRQQRACGCGQLDAGWVIFHCMCTAQSRCASCRQHQKIAQLRPEYH